MSANPDCFACHHPRSLHVGPDGLLGCCWAGGPRATQDEDAPAEPDTGEWCFCQRYQERFTGEPPARRDKQDADAVRAWCPECGPGGAIDEDGLCVHCGATAVGPGVDAAVLCYEAVRYALDRSQTDPDFRWVCGWGTEAWHRLVKAEAAYLGQLVEDVVARRHVDLQPDYRSREPEVVELRRRLAELGQ